jgi:hypothetical protein
MDKTTQAETLAGFVAALPGGTDQPANRAADVTAASAGLPASAVGWAVALGRRCAEAVLTVMGEDAAWLPEDETRRGIEFSVLSAVRRLVADVRDFPLSPDQVSIAHKMARHGLPYERYMLGLRMVQEILLEALLDEAARYRPATGRDGGGNRDGQAWLPGALALATSKFLDESAAAIVSEYLAESQRVIARTVASRRHVAIHDDADDTAGLCWITRAIPFPADYPARLTRALAAGEFRVAVGVPALGPSGFRRSYLAARDAERIARQGLPGKVTAYRDVDLAALLTADPERAQWFVADRLGKLADQDDETLADLRATALSYLESGCSLVRTAAALHVHRNTVLYRLGSIERLLGRELGASPLATHAALALVQRLGPALLDRDFAPRPPDGEELADATYL